MVFLKLGGSLITDKTRPETAHLDVLDRLADELQQARAGSAPAHFVGPRQRLLRRSLRLATAHGVASAAAGWLGFAEVADAAARLNRVVVGRLLTAGVPVWSIQPSAERAVPGWSIGGVAERHDRTGF